MLEWSKPLGEVSLAHNGVLFLDELPEFHRSTLEVMRQPLEDGKVTISRAAGSLTFPSEFMLVAAIESDSMDLLRTAVTNLNLSARAYDRILKVARTIADLAETRKIQVDHVAEAVQYDGEQCPPCHSPSSSPLGYGTMVQ